MLKTVSAITNAIGALNYKGTWNASTNTPALASGVGTKGDYYVVSVSGTTTLDGISTWGVGDWATFNGSVWQRVEGGADLNGVNLTLTGGAQFQTAGQGIEFSGNTPAAGMTSELLSWYEEGIWTPTFTNLTVTGSPIYSGEYTRIGRIVFFKIQINPNGGTVASTANSTYAGDLPYASSSAALCIASNADVANYGVGYVGGIYVSPPSWGATSRPVTITGTYTT